MRVLFNSPIERINARATHFNIYWKHDKVDQKNKYYWYYKSNDITYTYQNNKYLIHLLLAYAMVYQSRTAAGSHCYKL